MSFLEAAADSRIPQAAECLDVTPESCKGLKLLREEVFHVFESIIYCTSCCLYLIF